MHSTSSNKWIPNQSITKDLERKFQCLMTNGENNVWHFMERYEEASWIRKQTKVEDILATIKREKCTGQNTSDEQ